MSDNSIYERGKKIGRRIKEERRKKKLNQAKLGEAVGKLTGEDVGQATVSDWETGKTIPPIDRILALSKIFGCDCGYLLCDYNQSTHDLLEMCKATGLSERSIQCLCSLSTWEVTGYAKAIDFLLLDVQERDKSHNYRSVLDLLLFFLNYDNAGAPKKQIFTSGWIGDYNDDGYIVSNAIALNNRIVENAALMEMEQALIDLKRVYRQHAREESNG